MRFGTCDAPGYCGDHGKIRSVHSSLDFAKKAAKRAEYTSADGRTHKPVLPVVLDDEDKRGDWLSMGRASGKRARFC